MINTRYRHQISRCLLLAWILVLTKFILFKHRFYVYRNYFRDEFPTYSISNGWEKANLVPFKNIIEILRNNDAYVFSIGNIYGNILGFIPVGFLIPFAMPRFRNWPKVSTTVFAITLFFESVQLGLGTGIFDIDDLIMNTTGGFIGYLLTRIKLTSS